MKNPFGSKGRRSSPLVLLLSILASAAIGTAKAASTIATGQWDFEQGDLHATLGIDLEYGDGPAGRVKGHTSFGTTTSFSIPDIGGKVAKVMK